MCRHFIVYMTRHPRQRRWEHASSSLYYNLLKYCLLQYFLYNIANNNFNTLNSVVLGISLVSNFLIKIISFDFVKWITFCKEEQQYIFVLFWLISREFVVSFEPYLSSVCVGSRRDPHTSQLCLKHSWNGCSCLSLAWDDIRWRF